jgi:hypothetical protein
MGEYHRLVREMRTVNTLLLHTELPALEQAVRHINEEMLDVRAMGHIDEVALISGPNISGPINMLVSEEGVEHFNFAQDTVSVEPFGTAYDVSYNFFRTPYPWRIELMQITGGVSPLHAGYEMYRHQAGSLPVVHFSFKCAIEWEYEEACAALTQEGLSLAQECRSRYGRFSYWRDRELLDNRMVYLKPRVNLRDEQ